MSIVVKIEIDGKEVGRYEVDKKESPKEKPAETYSQYARFFDESSQYWEKSSEWNLLFLKQQEAYATNMLKSQGYLFLNDVYNMLGLPKSQTGQLVGWVYDTENPKGDNYVDFGIYRDLPSNQEFINGYRNTILLDFNVDGEIFSVLGEESE